MSLSKRALRGSSPIASRPAVIKKKFSSIKYPVTRSLRKANGSHVIPERNRVHVLRQGTEGLSEAAWGLLLNRIKAGMCTVFIGAGANDGILPAGPPIAEDWAQTYKFPFEVRELPTVAQFLSVEGGWRHFPHDDLVKRSKRQIDGIDLDRRIKSSPLALLAQLPVTCYMTTNYDGFMYRALELAGKKPQLHICKWYKNDDEMRPPEQNAAANSKAQQTFDPTVEGPVVFHLHGHASNPKSMVLTEDDYYDFLISWVRNQEMIPPLLWKALAKTSLLFIGYRLADMSFRVLFRSVFRAMDVDERVSNVAVQLPPRDVPESAKTYLRKYFKEAKIEMFWGEARVFIDQFRPRLHRAGIVP